MSILKKQPKSPSSLDKFRSKKSKLWLLSLALILLGIGAWYGLTIFFALKNATTANTTQTGESIIKQHVNKDPAVFNVLLIGVGGVNHPGGTLADSIMVASVDPKTKAVSLISIPRDLYVTLPNGGKDKINAAHAYGERNSAAKGGGPAVLKQVVSETLGLPIHYFVRIDFNGFKKIVDTLGGVTINVTKAINDPLYPDEQMKGYDPFSITAGVHKLDGKTALKYARSRETTSDFDRARRQQEILVAIKDKIASPQVLANPKKVTELITVLGNHLLTDFSSSEIDELIKIAKNFTSPTLQSVVIDNGENGLLMSSRASNGASILVPKAGASNFTAIQRFAQAFTNAPRIKEEKPSITLVRGSAQKDFVATIAKELETAGFAVTQSDTPATETKTSLLTRTGAKKDHTENFLNKTYTLSVTDTAASVTSTPSLTDYTLIINADLPQRLKAVVTKTETTDKPLSETETDDDVSAEEVTDATQHQTTPATATASSR